jgi:hypothetical protein
MSCMTFSCTICSVSWFGCVCAVVSIFFTSGVLRPRRVGEGDRGFGFGGEGEEVSYGDGFLDWVCPSILSRFHNFTGTALIKPHAIYIYL